jgi:hypothetical protein
MTHAELVVRAIRWLRNQKGCSFVLSEQFAAGVAEQPDAIGWKYGDQSHLIECKVSRSDFFADAAKPFRCNGAKGMGMFRYYMVPSGLVTAAEVQERYVEWGLLELMGRGVRVLLKPVAQIKHSEKAELEYLVSALRRTQYRLDEPLHTWLRWDDPGSPLRANREYMKVQRQRMKQDVAETKRSHQANLEWLLAQGPAPGTQEAQHSDERLV